MIVGIIRIAWVLCMASFVLWMLGWFKSGGGKMKHGLGLIKSPLEGSDFLVKSFIKKPTILTKYDITKNMSPVRNQGSEGSCAGFATAVGVKEYQEKLDYGHLVKLSPRYIYEKAKKISGHSKGTTLKACMQVITKEGVCEEKQWPYIAGDVGSPSPDADKRASKFKVLTYARIVNLNELKDAIVEFGATLIGIMVYKGMMGEQSHKTGIVPNPGCFERMNALGGHAITAVGFNDNSPFYKNDGHVKCKGSWGEEFGDKGYHYLSYKFMEKNMIDAFSCIDIDDPSPLKVENLSHFDMTKATWLRR